MRVLSGPAPPSPPPPPTLSCSPLQFENIQVEEAQNQEALESGKSELKDLLKQKKILEIQIKTLLTTVTTCQHKHLTSPEAAVIGAFRNTWTWFEKRFYNQQKCPILLSVQIKSLEDTIWKTKDEYNLRLQPICDIIRDLKNQLAEVTLQVEQQSVQNRDLLGIKMKLEQEIQKYDDLMCGITDPQR